MIVEPEFHGRRWIRLLQVHFAEHLKSRARPLPERWVPGRESLPGRMISLMLEVAAIGIRDRRKQKAENHS